MRTRTPEDIHVANEAFRVAERNLVRALPFSALAAPLVATLVTGRAPNAGNLAWIVVTAVLTAAHHVSPIVASRLSVAGRPQLGLAIACACAALCAAALGTAPVLATTSDQFTVALLCLTVVVFANVMYTAPVPVLSLAFHVGALATAVPVVLFRAERPGLLLFGLVVVTSSSAVNIRGVSQTVTTTIRLSRRNELLAQELTGANDELTAALRTIEVMAAMDELTGVSSRRSFLAALDHIVAGDEPCAVAIIDADHFKQVNDTHGHGVGDAVLVAIARAASQELRSVDTIGRLGGEEFAIVLPGLGLEAATAIVERVRAAVEAVDSAGARTTISAGVAESWPDGSRAELLWRADQALYGAKRAGRNRVEAWSQDRQHAL